MFWSELEMVLQDLSKKTYKQNSEIGLAEINTQVSLVPADFLQWLVYSPSFSCFYVCLLFLCFQGHASAPIRAMQPMLKIIMKN